MRRLAILLFLGAVPAPALAFTCTRVDANVRSPTQVWMSRCIPYYISYAGQNFDSEERIRLIQQSFAVWTGEACTDLAIVYKGRTVEDERFDVGEPESNLNVIASIEDDSSQFPDPGLLAITLTRFSVSTGEILDADILLNGTRFRFDEVTDVTSCNSGIQVFDLRNTLVHEMGHFIGFDHNTMVRDATMFPRAEKCEIEKRDLAADDRMGICNVYPKDQPTQTCTPPETYTPSGGLNPAPFRNQCDREPQPEGEPGGCSCGSTRRADGLFVLAVIALAWRRRR